jgi:hypothetical protein
MPLLRPWIREQNKHAPEASRRKLPQEFARIVGPQPNVAKTIPFQSVENLYSTVLVGFTSDDADLGVRPGLPDQVLPTAKPNLYPNLRNGSFEPILEVFSG